MPDPLRFEEDYFSDKITEDIIAQLTRIQDSCIHSKARPTFTRCGTDPEGHVPGITTAPSIWNTGAIGAGGDHRQFQMAPVLSITNDLVLRFIKPRGWDGLHDG